MPANKRLRRKLTATESQMHNWVLRAQAFGLAREMAQACGYTVVQEEDHDWLKLLPSFRRDLERCCLEVVQLAQAHCRAREQWQGNPKGLGKYWEERREQRLGELNGRLADLVKDKATCYLDFTKGSTFRNRTMSPGQVTRDQFYWWGNLRVLCEHPIQRTAGGAPLLGSDGKPSAAPNAWTIGLLALGQTGKLYSAQEAREGRLVTGEALPLDADGIPTGYLLWPRKVQQAWLEGQVGLGEAAPILRCRQELERAAQERREAAKVGLLPEEYRELQQEAKDRWLLAIRYWERLNEWAASDGATPAAMGASRRGVTLTERNWRSWLLGEDMRTYDAWLRRQPGWLSPAAWLRREAAALKEDLNQQVTGNLGSAGGELP